MKNYFYLLVLLCTLKTVAQATNCVQPIFDSDNKDISISSSGNYYANNQINVTNVNATYSNYLAGNSIVLGQDFRGYTLPDYENHEIKAYVWDCSICSCINNLGIYVNYETNYGYPQKSYELISNDANCDLENLTNSGYLSFDWYVNDEFLWNEFDIDYQFLHVFWDDYPAVKVVVTMRYNGCTNTLYFQEENPWGSSFATNEYPTETTTITSTKSVTETEELAVSPNPSFGVFDVSGQFKKGMEIIVTNQFNVQVLKSVAKADNKELIDLTGFPPGIYIVKFIGINAIYTGKLIKG